MIPFLVRWGLEKDIVDSPEERKIHRVAKPRLGGIAICMGLLFSILCFCQVTPAVRGILAGGLLLFWAGVMDDLKGLSARQKLTGQVLSAAVAVAVGGLTISNLGNLFGFGDLILPPWIGVPFTIFAIVGMINAINLFDGLDGLAAGVSIIALSIFIVFALFTGNRLVVTLGAGLLGALLAFLKYNFYPARIFMGDAGSMLCGFCLACLAIVLTQAPNSSPDLVSPALPVLVLGLPIMDTLWVMGRRLGYGRNPFAPDKTHLHHRLLQLGFSHLAVVLTIWAGTLGWGFLAVLLRHSPEYFALGLFLVLSLVRYALLKGLLKGLRGRPQGGLVGRAGLSGIVRGRPN